MFVGTSRCVTKHIFLMNTPESVSNLGQAPRCVWVTHEKECVYSHLFVCSFEDKNRCVAVTHFVLECKSWI